MTRQYKTLHINAILSQIDQASGLSDLQPLIEDLRDKIGVDHMVYHWVNSKGASLGVGTYSDIWRNRYLELGYVRVDPVILGCSQQMHPADWKTLDWSSKAARAFLRDALDHGIGNQGLSVPIRGPLGQYGLFTVNHRCSDQEWAEFIETHRADLIVLSHVLNTKVIALEGEEKSQLRRALSPRETESLTLLAIGYSRAQVAQTMQISEHTLRAYIESARLKLGAANTIHAIASALTQGVILI